MELYERVNAYIWLTKHTIQKKKIQNEDKVQDCRSYQRFFSDEENIYQSVFKNQIHVRLQNLALGLIF